jgi:CHAT domain-containing protein
MTADPPAGRERRGSSSEATDLSRTDAAVLVAGPGNARGRAEIDAIGSVRPGSVVLTGAAATPADTLAALERADVAHLAAHGHHQPQNALFSTLDLDGGPLFGYDLQQLRRTPRVVVLSSCELGLSDVRPGDETLGMVTALLNAGTSTVVASVTRVDDAAAMAVTVAYHGGTAGGTAPAAALAAASAAYPDAGFVCFGAG